MTWHDLDKYSHLKLFLVIMAFVLSTALAVAGFIRWDTTDLRETHATLQGQLTQLAEVENRAKGLVDTEQSSRTGEIGRLDQERALLRANLEADTKGLRDDVRQLLSATASARQLHTDEERRFDALDQGSRDQRAANESIHDRLGDIEKSLVKIEALASALSPSVAASELLAWVDPQSTSVEYQSSGELDDFDTALGDRLLADHRRAILEARAHVDAAMAPLLADATYQTTSAMDTLDGRRVFTRQRLLSANMMATLEEAGAAWSDRIELLTAELQRTAQEDYFASLLITHQQPSDWGAIAQRVEDGGMFVGIVSGDEYSPQEAEELLRGTGLVLSADEGVYGPVRLVGDPNSAGIWAVKANRASSDR